MESEGKIDICKEATGNPGKEENQKEEVVREEGPRPGKELLDSWLNCPMKIRLTDGRTLVGDFLCTDKQAHLILGSCREYLSEAAEESEEEPRVLGLAMIPGRHIVSIHIDEASVHSRTL